MTETVDKALEIAGIGIAGVFVFMIIFYLMIIWLDKLLPFKEEVKVENPYIEENNEEEIEQ